MKEGKTLEQLIMESIKNMYHRDPNELPVKMNGWVKLVEFHNGTSICKHTKKGYIAHFFLN